jgi:hypothetical protein
MQCPLAAPMSFSLIDHRDESDATHLPIWISLNGEPVPGAQPDQAAGTVVLRGRSLTIRAVVVWRRVSGPPCASSGSTGG